MSRTHYSKRKVPMCPRCGCTETHEVGLHEDWQVECANCGLNCGRWEAYALEKKAFDQLEARSGKRFSKDVKVELAATLGTLNDTGIAMFAHGLVDALSGSPDQTSLKLFLAGLPKRYKVLALSNHSAVMRRGNL